MGLVADVLWFFVEPSTVASALSIGWALQLPFDATMTLNYSLVVALTYLLYAIHFHGSKWLPKPIHSFWWKFFPLWVVYFQKFVWIVGSAAACGLTWQTFFDGWLTTPLWQRLLGLLILSVGQLFNISVFYTLGKDGVYYGARWGRSVPWVDGFPFIVKDPQYMGVTLTLAGLSVAVCGAETISPSLASCVLGLLIGDFAAHLPIKIMERTAEPEIQQKTPSSRKKKQ